MPALLAPAPEPRFAPVLMGDRHTIRDTQNGAIAVPKRLWTAEVAQRWAAELNVAPAMAYLFLDWVAPDSADVAEVA